MEKGFAGCSAVPILWTHSLEWIDWTEWGAHTQYSVNPEIIDPFGQIPLIALPAKDLAGGRFLICLKDCLHALPQLSLTLFALVTLNAFFFNLTFLQFVYTYHIEVHMLTILWLIFENSNSIKMSNISLLAVIFFTCTVSVSTCEFFIC